MAGRRCPPRASVAFRRRRDFRHTVGTRSTRGDSMTQRETVVHFRENLRFTATTPSGFDIELDSSTTADGPLSAPTPMEMQIVALGGCSGMDVISVLRKMRQDVTSYDVRLTNVRATEHPGAYTSIDLLHAVRGRNVGESNVRRAIELSMQRYCPIYAMLHPTVAITERYEIVDETTGDTVAGVVELPADTSANPGE
jgi:putative redox protein